MEKLAHHPEVQRISAYLMNQKKGEEKISKEEFSKQYLNELKKIDEDLYEKMKKMQIVPSIHRAREAREAKREGGGSRRKTFRRRTTGVARQKTTV